MSGRAVARGAIVSIAAVLAFAVPAQANDAAHKIAEKFAGDGADTKTKAAEAKKLEAEPGDAAAKREAERKVEEARKQAARKKADAARKAAEAKRRAAAKAAQDARRVAEQRRADETEMLARARREADDMRTAAEEARLTEEARRLIEQAEKERAKAEELLASEADAPKRSPEPAVAKPEQTKTGEAELLARQRTEETRRLAEKLNRVRQAREARLARQVHREAEQRDAAATAAPPPPSQPEPAPVTAAVGPVPASASANTPASAPEAVPAPAPAEAAAPVAASAAPPPAPPQADPRPPKPEAVATAPTSPPTPVAQESAAAPPADEPAVPKRPEPNPHVAVAPTPSAAPPPVDSPTKSAVEIGASRVTVLLVLVPGTYGIRRNGPKVADPVLCTRDGCYVSAGADRPAAFLPRRKALGLGNTWGARAGACRNALGCVFRDVELGPLPGFLQPVDLHIFKHDLRLGHAVLADSDCRAAAGRLLCRHGIDADNYTMWIVPEILAAAAGPAALQQALTEGLNGPRSAALAPR